MAGVPGLGVVGDRSIPEDFITAFKGGDESLDSLLSVLEDNFFSLDSDLRFSGRGGLFNRLDISFDLASRSATDLRSRCLGFINIFY